MAGESKDNWEGTAPKTNTNPAVDWSTKGVDLADPATRPVPKASEWSAQSSFPESTKFRHSTPLLRGELLNATAGALPVEAPVIPRVEVTAPRSDIPPTGKDPVLANGVLKFNAGDNNIDAALARPDYKRVEIEMPPGISLNHGVDQQGYYFTFNKPNGDNADGSRHYYPQNAKEMCESNKVYNLDSQRLQSNEVAANSSSGRAKYFEDLNHGLPPNAPQVVQFAGRLSTISKAVLVAQENSLTASIRAQEADPNSVKNPYFKIYLADVYTAQAMQPIMEQFVSSGGTHINLDNPQTVQRIDTAIKVLSAANSESKLGMQRETGSNLPGNIMTPMNPYEYYRDRNKPGVPYGFWGGSQDQSWQRLVALNTLRNLITTKSLPSVMGMVVGKIPGGFELLPPIQTVPRY